VLPCAGIGSKGEKPGHNVTKGIREVAGGHQSIYIPRRTVLVPTHPADGCPRPEFEQIRNAEVKGSFGHEGTPSRWGWISMTGFILDTSALIELFSGSRIVPSQTDPED